MSLSPSEKSPQDSLPPIIRTAPFNAKKPGVAVFISGPYTFPDPVANTSVVIKVWHELRDKGYYPFAPHAISLTLHLVTPRSYEDWLDWDQYWLFFCDCVLRLPGRSLGADREIESTRKWKMPIFRSVEELYKNMPPDSV